MNTKWFWMSYGVITAHLPLYTLFLLFTTFLQTSLFCIINSVLSFIFLKRLYCRCQHLLSLRSWLSEHVHWFLKLDITWGMLEFFRVMPYSVMPFYVLSAIIIGVNVSSIFCCSLHNILVCLWAEHYFDSSAFSPHYFNWLHYFLFTICWFSHYFY